MHSVTHYKHIFYFSSMKNKEAVEKARQEYIVSVKELGELIKVKPYPKEAIDNKIKERNKLSKKLDDLKAETKSEPKTRIMTGPTLTWEEKQEYEEETKNNSNFWDLLKKKLEDKR